MTTSMDPGTVIAARDSAGARASDGIWLAVLLALLCGRAVLPTLVQYLTRGRPGTFERADQSTLALTISTSFSLALLATTALVFLLTRGHKESDRVVLVWLLVVLTGCASLVLSANGVQYTTILVVLSCLLSMLRIRPPVALAERVVRRLLVTVSLLALVLVAVRPEVAKYGVQSAGWLSRDARLAGPFSTPNEMANVAALTVVAVVAARDVGRAHRAAMLAVGGLALALTQSYTAWFACILGCAAVLLVRTRRRGVPLYAVPLIALALAFVARLVTTVEENASLSTLSGRRVAWDYVGAHWTESFWTGRGANAWRALIEAGKVPFWAVHAHNQFLDALFVGGVVGVAVLALALTLTTIALFRGGRAGAAMGLGLVIVELVRSYTEVPFQIMFGGFNLFVVVALISMTRIERSEVRDE